MTALTVIRCLVVMALAGPMPQSFCLSMSRLHRVGNDLKTSILKDFSGTFSILDFETNSKNHNRNWICVVEVYLQECSHLDISKRILGTCSLELKQECLLE